MCSESWLGWLHLETADTVTLGLHVSGDSGVTLLTPGCAPGVFDDPVVFATLSSVSDEEDTVVEGATAEVLHDTTEVELPGDSGVNSNCNWSFLKGSGKSLWVLWSHIAESLELSNTSRSVTGTISTGVWVVRLSLNLV